MMLSLKKVDEWHILGCPGQTCKEYCNVFPAATKHGELWKEMTLQK